MSPEIASAAAEQHPQPQTPATTRTAARRRAGGQESASERRPSEVATCSGCSERWKGRAAAHCSACHQTFSAITLFDRHRSAAGLRGACVDPSTIKGCEFRDGMWRGPQRDGFGGQ